MGKESLALVIFVSILFAIGLSMVFNTIAAEVLDRSLERSIYQALFRQILYAVIGLAGAVGIWLLGANQIIRLSGIFLAAGTVLLALVFIPGIGQELNGAKRWISLGGVSFQPSEFIKYLAPIYYIGQITTMSQPILVKDFLRLLAKIAIPIGLILIEPDNGTAAIMMASLVMLFVLTKVRLTYWALPLLVLSIGGIAVASQMPHVKSRIWVYLNPELDLQGKGHQPHQAKIAAGSGGLLGKGLGQSMQKLDYLPEARSDYIAAIYAEEFGFAGMAALILLYMGIGFCGFSIAFKTTDTPAFYTVAILTFLICFQAFLNLGVVSGLLPSKGTNLPFFSQGGSSLLANFMMVSLILNIANRSRVHA